MISIVIPCYGSEKTLGLVVAEIRSLFEKNNLQYEVIMVCDASPDHVFNIISDLCKKDPVHYKGIELARNFGQHAALMAGYRECSGNIVISLDDDGQAPIESIPELIQEIEKGRDVVYGAYEQKKHNAFRNLGSKINDWMAECLLGKPKKIRVSSFFAMRRFIVDELIRYKGSFPYLLGLVLRSTSNISNIPVNHRFRTEGKSGYTFKRLLRLWLNGFTAFSVIPLRFATFLGFLCAIVGSAGCVWTIVNKLLHSDVPLGYSSIMAVTTFIGGMLMLMLGIIGEYVGRIYICINSSPQYVIKSKC